MFLSFILKSAINIYDFLMFSGDRYINQNL